MVEKYLNLREETSVNGDRKLVYVSPGFSFSRYKLETILISIAVICLPLAIIDYWNGRWGSYDSYHRAKSVILILLFPLFLYGYYKWVNFLDRGKYIFTFTDDLIVEWKLNGNIIRSTNFEYTDIVAAKAVNIFGFKVRQDARRARVTLEQRRWSSNLTGLIDYEDAKLIVIALNEKISARASA